MDLFSHALLRIKLAEIDAAKALADYERAKDSLAHRNALSSANAILESAIADARALMRTSGR